jgi:hypothetical protein
LKPTPIYQPNKRITFEKRKKYALQKKTNTERVNNETEDEHLENKYNNTCFHNENEGISNLMISSGSVDSKLKKNKMNLNNNRLVNGMKKSYEGDNILDINFDDLEKNQELYDTQKLYDDDLEPPQEEIKIEINKDIKANNDNTNKNNKKLNNFFDDLDDLNEDNMQKLNLKPTPIYQPNKRITFEKRKKYALQKKTNTERVNDETEEEHLENKYNNTCFQNENEGISNLMISSGSVDSKLKKNKMNMNDNKFINGMKKSYEGNNILDINFNDLEKNQELDDTQKLYDDDLEPPQEEIKIEINKDIETNNDNKYKNNTNGEVPTDINTMATGNVIEEQENLISNHIDIIKSEAKLLSEEGNLISKIKGISEENYSMEAYVPEIEEIIKLKLNYFHELKEKIKEYKSLFKAS